jgi:hypothetical protein
MGEVINLRLARKDREKRQRADKARANRIAHGRTKPEREMTEATGKLERAKLDAQRLESGEAPPDDEIA